MSEGDGTPRRPLAVSIGRRVRRARTAAGLTVRELAVRCDVSQPFVSQVENGQAMPSVVTLLKLADALDTPLQALIDGPSGSGEAVSIVREGEGGEAYEVVAGTEARARVLVHGQSEIEALEFTAGPGAWLGPHLVHRGKDFVFVIAGELEVDLGDEGLVRLRPGDSLSHSGSVSHQWRAIGDQPVRFICVVIDAQNAVGDGVPSPHGAGSAD